MTQSNMTTKLVPCPLRLSTVITDLHEKKFGGKIRVTLILGNRQGVYLMRQGRFSFSLHDDVTLDVGQALGDVPELLGFPAAALSSVLRVSGMVRSENGVHVLLGAEVAQSPFSDFELADSAPYLQGLCSGHPLAQHLHRAIGLN